MNGTERAPSGAQGRDLESRPVVFVVDDDDAVRRAISRLLGSAGFSSEAFSSPAEFLERRSHDGPACLLLDLKMPGMDGLELQRRLNQLGRTIPIVFLTGHGDVPTSVRAMRGGAVDFLLKPFTDTDLLAAIETALARDRAELGRRLERESLHGRLTTLTLRERQVFDLVVQGLLNKQIAGRLGTTEKTIKAHRGNVMRKMSADSLAMLVHYAEQISAAVGPDEN